MNQRLHAAGHRLYCTWKTRCLYHPQATIKGLATYAFRNGYWNAISLRDNPASMRARHVAPFAWVLNLLGCALLAASGLRTSKRTAVRRSWPGAVLLGLTWRRHGGRCPDAEQAPRRALCGSPGFRRAARDL